MLEQEFKYYLENQSELVKKYFGRFIVIIGKSVVGDYATEVEAYKAASKKYELGKFMIQEALPGTENYSQTFTSRVIF